MSSQEIPYAHCHLFKKRGQVRDNKGFWWIISFGFQGLPWWLSGKESGSECRRLEFDPWVRKIPRRRKWQPTPVFLTGKFHRQRSLVGYSLWGHKRVRLNWVTKQQHSLRTGSLLSPQSQQHQGLSRGESNSAPSQLFDSKFPEGMTDNFLDQGNTFLCRRTNFSLGNTSYDGSTLLLPSTLLVHSLHCIWSHTPWSSRQSRSFQFPSLFTYALEELSPITAILDQALLKEHELYSPGNQMECYKWCHDKVTNDSQSRLVLQSQ